MRYQIMLSESVLNIDSNITRKIPLEWPKSRVLHQSLHYCKLKCITYSIYLVVILLYELNLEITRWQSFWNSLDYVMRLI